MPITLTLTFSDPGFIPFTQQQILLPASGTQSVNNISLSGDGTLLALGQHLRTISSSQDGRVLIYERTGGVHGSPPGPWELIQIINRPAPEFDVSSANWGRTIEWSRDGSTLLVGARRHTVPSDQGAVSVIQNLGGSPQWEVVQNILSSGSFGIDIGVDGTGNRFIVGSSSNSPLNGGSGSVYVNTGGSPGPWELEQRLQPPGVGTADQAGTRVDINNDGTLALLGNPAEDDAGVNRGSASFHRRFGSGSNPWSVEDEVVGSDTASFGDEFGYDVALSKDGEHAVIGDWAYDNPTNSGTGYYFTPGEGSPIPWSQVQQITDPPGSLNSRRFEFVSISQDGKLLTHNTRFGGNTYVYFLENGQYTLKQTLPSNGLGAAQGVSISSNGRYIAVGYISGTVVWTNT